MMRHSDIWLAIDSLARDRGLSPSGLARRAGLDPTTFNKSKRITRDGKLRWPSTESIAKVLEATGAELADFVTYMNGEAIKHVRQSVPLIGLAQAGKSGYFDDAGYPAGAGWEEITFPDMADTHAYALEIAGDSMEPVYRDGDVVVVSPGSSIRRGDRIIAKTRAGEVFAKVLKRRTAQRYELKSLNPLHSDVIIPLEDLDWISRIVWASQ